MNDKYGTPIVVGGRVAKLGLFDDIAIGKPEWHYGTVTSLNVLQFNPEVLNEGDSLMVNFDGEDYSYISADNTVTQYPLGETVNNEDLIVCESDVDYPFPITVTFTINARSRNEAIEKIKPSYPMVSIR